jgi:hypothetical protein
MTARAEPREGTAQLGRTCSETSAMMAALLVVVAAIVRRMR